MSYSTENILPKGVKVAQIVAFAELLGYSPWGTLRAKDAAPITTLGYFETKNYRSWVPVELSVSLIDGRVNVGTRTRIGRSHYDFEFQTTTARKILRWFGGTLTEDGPDWFTPGPPFPPEASGCHLAIERLDWHLNRIKAFRFGMGEISKPQNQAALEKFMPVMRELNPEVFLGNLLLPYVVSMTESYLKDTYIALLRYSKRKAAILKGARLNGEQLAAVSDGGLTIEEAVAENMPFQRLSAVGKHFQELDPKLDILGELRRPFRNRKRRLLDDIEGVISKRHDLIHRMTLDHETDLPKMDGVVADMHAAMNRIHVYLTKYYEWPYERTNVPSESRPRKRKV